MPEYAEVYTITKQLKNKYDGKCLRGIKIVGGKYLKKDNTNKNMVVFPLNNINFECSGKFIYCTFDNSELAISCGLGMTASFGDFNKHSALELDFENHKLYFNDIRRFGNFKFITQNELKEKLNSLGWDPIKEEFTDKQIKMFRNKNHKTISESLLDQKLANGIGNYLRSEALYRAKINPFKNISQLTNENLYRLARELKIVIEEACEHGGATLANYKDMNGVEGTFYQKFKVYSKKQDPFGNPVVKAKSKEGRSIWFCPALQS